MYFQLIIYAIFSNYIVRVDVVRIVCATKSETHEQEH